ncbi:hypothetical protein SLA2020_188860 [Shorea laevis]
MSKLHNLKKALQTWSRNVPKRPQEEIDKLQKQLDDLQQNQTFINTIEPEENLIKQINTLWTQDEAHWFQIARINWINFGDKNTKYFHAVATRRQNNHIFQLKDDTAQMNEDLCKEVSYDEIKAVVFQLGSYKAPSIDGFPGCFYQQHWDLVANDVCKAVKHFFDNGYMLREMNRTQIVLVPKIRSPEVITHFRPISLCNFSYKIISKLLANRLKGYLDRLISPFQSAFILGRSIQDNIMIAHEAFHGLKLKKTGVNGFLALKLDIRKAYDSVDWSCLEHVLHAHGFCEKWIHWIMQCVTTISYTVLVNAVAQKQSSGYRIRNRSPVISHLLFADDSLVFCKANLGEVSHLQYILQLYSNTTEQSVNCAKSTAIFSTNTTSDLRASICNQLGINHDSEVSKYL